MANSTQQGMLKTYEEQFCSVEITETAHTPLICLSVINVFLSVAAFLGNGLILVALSKEATLHPPSRLLLRSLATTDLCVGIVAEPLIVVYWISVMKQNWKLCRYAQSAVYLAGHILCSVSMLTLTTIAVERLLALLLGLRYGQVVTLKRTFITITGFWVLSIVGSTMYFVDYIITFRFGYVGSLLCLAISFVCYAKIFFTLRRKQQHNRVQHHDLCDSATINKQFNIARYKNAVNSALWLQVALIFFYLPYVVVVTLVAALGLSPFIYLARQTAVTLLFTNSSLNPLLYCWKIKEVRKIVKDTVTKLYSFSS
ncbi:melanocyte-stimulating hormone receptor-like [Montipora capricornis]|uniref:melanocyte-stimulating hormone receptor-like n=1 Tax=Montipora capricornis TaxID=246305 RepID=UPI0035F1CEE2